MLPGVPRPAHAADAPAPVPGADGSDDELTEDMIRDVEDMNAILDQFLALSAMAATSRWKPPTCRADPRSGGAYNQQQETVRLCVEPMPPFALRRVSIKRLLVNLIENALRCRGGVEVCLCSATSTRPTWCSACWIVAGVDPAELEGIFNPFIRGDRARGGQGAGPGDRQAHRLAAWRGGRVAQSRGRWSGSAGQPAAGAAARDAVQGKPAE